MPSPGTAPRWSPVDKNPHLLSAALHQALASALYAHCPVRPHNSLGWGAPLFSTVPSWTGDVQTLAFPVKSCLYSVGSSCPHHAPTLPLCSWQVPAGGGFVCMSCNTVGNRVTIPPHPGLTTMVHSVGNSEDSNLTPTPSPGSRTEAAVLLGVVPPPRMGVAGLWEGKVSGSIPPPPLGHGAPVCWLAGGEPSSQWATWV